MGGGSRVYIVQICATAQARAGNEMRQGKSTAQQQRQPHVSTHKHGTVNMIQPHTTKQYWIVILALGRDQFGAQVVVHPTV